MIRREQDHIATLRFPVARHPSVPAETARRVPARLLWCPRFPADQVATTRAPNERMDPPWWTRS